MSRLLSLATIAVVLATSPSASAQTTINLNTAKGNCVAVTDQAGLTLAPGSANLQANGVTLTATQAGACNPVGGTSSTFVVSVQISGSEVPGTPYTPKLNVPFYVIWSASADAARCTRGGSIPAGATGWQVGSTIGPGSYQDKVTPTAAGDYNFSVTCTNASGYATALQNIPQPTTPAPTPNPITLTVPATASPGVSFSVTWPAMSNAATCVGTGTLNGAPASNLGDWTSLNTVTSPRSVMVPAGATGPLKLTLTCWNADNSASAVGTSSDIALSAATTSCPTEIDTPQGKRYLLTTSNVSYTITGQQVRSNVNLLEWDSVWGYGNATGAGQPWPGVVGSWPVIKQFARDSYMGVHFKTSATPPPKLTGFFQNPNYSGGANVIMAVSKVCGDLSANLPTAGCFVDHNYGDPPGTGAPASDSQMVTWKFSSNAPASQCNLQPNTDYYVNLYYADKAQVTPKCPAGSTLCPVSPVSNWGISP